MPSYDYSSSNRRTVKGSASASYDKILAVFNPSPSDTSTFARTNRAKVAFQSSLDYESALKVMEQDGYQNAAGCDLSALLMPFQTRHGSVSGLMPGFDPSATPVSTSGVIDLSALLPFRWDTSSPNTIQDRWVATSGDGYPGVLSAEKCYVDPAQYRDLNDIRGIAVRLPLMAAGWGYDMFGKPFPSGSMPDGSAGFRDRPAGGRR